MNPTNMIEQNSTSMKCRRIDCTDLPVCVRMSLFKADSDVTEIHLSAAPTAPGDIGEQLSWLNDAYHAALDAIDCDTRSAVFRRLFCSDPANQYDEVIADPLGQTGYKDQACAVSIVGQSPAPPAKVALLAYHVHDPAEHLVKSHDGSALTLRRGRLKHHWTTGMSAPTEVDSRQQSRSILTDYERYLQASQMSLADNTIRTWLFLRDIDVNYQGMVQARRKLFNEQGLNADTHYIASTGIGGLNPDHHALVTMDAWSVAGLDPSQVRYLKAGDHLSATDVYGVTFERGTVVSYRDREHIIISGTASIDQHGQIMHPGNIYRQLNQTMNNIMALLNEAGASTCDVAYWIVYLRDVSDLTTLNGQIHKWLGNAPMVLVQAPVCRPGWLIEIECLAISPAHLPDLPNY